VKAQSVTLTIQLSSFTITQLDLQNTARMSHAELEIDFRLQNHPKSLEFYETNGKT
jgi:hypothetical protein